jgi:hypothetical protein
MGTRFRNLANVFVVGVSAGIIFRGKPCHQFAPQTSEFPERILDVQPTTKSSLLLCVVPSLPLG